ncbi:hypothetical protein GlitD10_0178 [Gloeomargarita lithophora Alchichica-D10]|uniref:CRISPR type III-B/RAMP module-associated protein Cmr5 n=1 Tax=Gloeomargarita lithophora Alchichica-D10 TaxID=1188229 RepID=A0A1J0A985_9CYAN|nr:hypothetical protein [Gloeomargarita lithophora]APB32479.1 hypothetical protein GlitD10_0178 [Gloeomargarita lithophora Alchichica-D10]
MMKLDSRKFSQQAFDALTELKQELQETHYKRASGQVRNLATYTSVWGLHRLSGDAKKYLQGTAEDTKYKGKVYKKFLQKLQSFSGIDFDPNNEATLINMPLKTYTSLNRLAIELAREWSFWTPAVLGEPENE